MARWFIFAVAMAGALGVGNLVMSGRIALFDLVYLVVIAQMSLVGPVLICLLTTRNGSVNQRWGWLPIFTALTAGYTSAFIGKTAAGYNDLYNFAPVVTILMSLVTAYVLRPKALTV